MKGCFRQLLKMMEALPEVNCSASRELGNSAEQPAFLQQILDEFEPDQGIVEGEQA